MPWQIKKDVDHGAGNPIVARLSYQVLDILRHTTANKELSERVGAAYLGLMRKLLTLYETNERFLGAFKDAAAAMEQIQPGVQAIEVPQIPKLDAEARNFVYEAKVVVRDCLQVVNLLHGTTFEDASEFTNAKKRKGAVSFIDFVKQTYGDNPDAGEELKKAGALVNHVVALRNAAEHPGGFSGTLVIRNFELEDGKFTEPTWHRVDKDGKNIHAPSSIRADYDTIVDGLVLLGEEIFISWAATHLKGEGMMVLAHFPDDQVNPELPVRYALTLRPDLAARIGAAGGKKRGVGEAN